MSVVEPTAQPHRRLSAADRRRQLIGIGLSRIVETPIQDLSMDEIAAQAGISRSLLFHYFPTKTDFYEACIAAAARRVLRNTAPDPSLAGPDRVRQMVEALIGQIVRRRALWIAMVRGQLVPAPNLEKVVSSVMSGNTDRVVDALDLREDQRSVVHAWWAYVEDRALMLGPHGQGQEAAVGLAAECVAALDALLEVSAGFAP